jgi:hypothetical protein
LAGTDAVVETSPEMQGTVEGIPLIVCVEEKTQFVALVTFAESVTTPPMEVSEEGVTSNALTVGGEGFVAADFAGEVAEASEAAGD